MKIENLTADLEFYRELKSRLEEALLEGASQLEVSIAGRTVRYRSFDEMLRAKQFVEREIERIENAIKLLNGERVSRKIQTRFTG